jgi:malic enzyme
MFLMWLPACCVMFAMWPYAAQAIGVPISKLALHTACGGVEPATTMPVVFDVGTDNEDLLRSPLYVGVRHRCV